MERFEHGGDIYAHEGVIDFSANINPLGMPPRAQAALRDSVGAFEAYPDPACRELCEALAQVHGVPMSQIVCTAGATDLMHRVCTVLKPENALVTAPCFSGYEQALEQAGTTIHRHTLLAEEDFALTEAILDHPLIAASPSNAAESSPASEAMPPSLPPGSPKEVSEAPSGGAASAGSAVRQNGGALMFLCTPNNPTGLTIGRELLVRILEAAAAAGVVVVLDECFADFTGEPSAVDLCGRFPNLVVMRAFTKLYAMAGLRLGYGICANEQLVARLGEAGQTWTVSTPAQVAGVAALAEEGWIERTRGYVDAQRALLRAGLERVGMRVVPSQANYLLFQSPCELYEPLLKRGFLVRRCANYVGLDESWYRIAVRTEEENAAFLAALDEVMSPSGADAPAHAAHASKEVCA